MRLANFIDGNSTAILADCERFALGLFDATRQLDPNDLRDHTAAILAAIVDDMKSPQTVGESADKALGLRDRAAGAAPTAASIRGSLRAILGLDVEQTIAEYRVLRASVIRRWLESTPTLGIDDVADLIRFNEAVDQAMSETVAEFGSTASRNRLLFLGVVSHELRTPLGSIMASTDALSDQRADADQRAAAVARIARAGLRMSAILDDLLDYVRGRTGGDMRIQPAPLALDELCTRVATELRGTFPAAPIAVHPRGDMRVEWDEQRITQAIANLAANAIKYGQPATPVDITLDGEQAQSVRIAVHNFGRPISKGQVGRLFDPFVRGDGDEHRGSSLGLGLYLVREVAEAHGGSVTVESSAEAGTTFVMTLPRSSAAAERTARVPH